MKRLLLAVMLLVPALTARASDKTLLIELEQRSGALPGGVSASGAVVVGALRHGRRILLDADDGRHLHWRPGRHQASAATAAPSSERRSTRACTPGRDLAARGGVEVARLVQAGRRTL